MDSGVCQIPDTLMCFRIQAIREFMWKFLHYTFHINIFSSELFSQINCIEPYFGYA